MLSDTYIIEIVKAANKSLFTSIDGHIDGRSKLIKVAVFDVFPFISSLSFVFLISEISESMINIIITGLSIFSGLFFSLIIVVTDKAKEIKKEYLLEVDDEKKNYSIRYLNFSKQLISQISYAIFVALIVIIIAFISRIHISNPFDNLEKNILQFIPILKNLIIKIMNMAIYLFLIKFVILLFLIVSSMYAMFLEQINSHR